MFVEYLQSIFSNVEATVSTQLGNTTHFNIDCGVYHGCLFSSVFMLVINKFINILNGLLFGGLLVGSVLFKCLMFVDDIALIATSSDGIKTAR